MILMTFTKLQLRAWDSMKILYRFLISVRLLYFSFVKVSVLPNWLKFSLLGCCYLGGWFSFIYLLTLIFVWFQLKHGRVFHLFAGHTLCTAAHVKIALACLIFFSKRRFHGILFRFISTDSCWKKVWNIFSQNLYLLSDAFSMTNSLMISDWSYWLLRKTESVVLWIVLLLLSYIRHWTVGIIWVRIGFLLALQL